MKHKDVQGQRMKLLPVLKAVSRFTGAEVPPYSPGSITHGVVVNPRARKTKNVFAKQYQLVQTVQRRRDDSG